MRNREDSSFGHSKPQRRQVFIFALGPSHPLPKIPSPIAHIYPHARFAQAAKPPSFYLCAFVPLREILFLCSSHPRVGCSTPGNLNSLGNLIQNRTNLRFQNRQLIFYNVPYNFEINAEIFMNKLVP
jgi:hypothetical protein